VFLFSRLDNPVEGTVVVNGVGSVHKNLFSSWSVGYSFNTENFVINYNAADNTTASLARVGSGAIDYLITDGRIDPANLPADALQVPVTGSALVMAINLDGVNVSSLVLPSPSPSFFLRLRSGPTWPANQPSSPQFPLQLKYAY
jgi:ABC-type phosphate transport system substrate-binding protein